MRKSICILLCLVMVLASLAMAFADTSQGTATTLRLEKTEGKLGITKSGGKSVTVKNGIRLYDGYELKTEKKSAAYVSLDSAKAIMMDSSTDVAIKKSGKKLEIMLKSGTVLVNVEEKLAGDEELNIRTTNSVTGIRGTIIQASYNPKTGNTEIYVFEGRTFGNYLAPDGTWYTQELTTGSWLASGTGMLSDHPDENGWKQEEGHWVYTNNDLDETGFGTQCWSEDKGWYTVDGETGEETEQDAWVFRFKDLQPRFQRDIRRDSSMLERGQEHLDLYPELAEQKLPETEAAAEQALSEQYAAEDAKELEIMSAFETGNGGNSVDNLFQDEIYIPATGMVTIINNTGIAIADPSVAANDDGTYTVPYGTDFTFRLADNSIAYATVGTTTVPCENDYYTVRANGFVTVDLEPLASVATRTAGVTLSGSPTHADIESYGNNVIGMTSAGNGIYSFIVPQAEAFTFKVETDHDGPVYGVSDVQNANRLDKQEFEVPAANNNVDISIARLYAITVDSPNGTVVPSEAMNPPYEIGSNGVLYVAPGNQLSLKIAEHSNTDGEEIAAIEHLNGMSHVVATSATDTVTLNVGDDMAYTLVYAPHGFYKVNAIGCANTYDFSVLSTNVLYQFNSNGDLGLIVEKGSDLVFTANSTGANVVLESDPYNQISLPLLNGVYTVTVSENLDIHL